MLGRRGVAASPGYACAGLLAIALGAGSCGEAPPAAPEPPRQIRADELVNTGCPPLPPISGFVGRADGALLLDGLTAWRATGTNLYYLQQLLSYAQQEQDPQALEAVREVLDDLVCLSLPVARIWGFNDSKDTSSIRRSPWEGFREEGLRGLDQAVWEAKRRGIRLIVPLVNNWAEYGGLPAYAAWASKLYGSPVDRDDFFRDAADEAVVEGLRLHAGQPGEHLHRNSLRRRAGHPRLGDRQRAAVFELRRDDPLPDTVAELATFLKQIAPQQLVADGGDGFDDDPTPYAGLSNTYAVRGDDGCSFSKLSRIDALDMLRTTSTRATTASRPRATPSSGSTAHQDLAMVTGKIAYLGECGFAAPDVERAQNYDEWLRRLFALSGGAARAVLAALTGRPGEQRRLRHLLTPGQRDRLDPRPLGQGHPLKRSPDPVRGRARVSACGGWPDGRCRAGSARR